MTAYLPWLFLLACPLMMLFMMRGMGGGSKKAPDEAKTALHPARPVGDQQVRIAQLEREVAELRGVSLRKTENNPASRR